jgi:hypothetical protein
MDAWVNKDYVFTDEHSAVACIKFFPGTGWLHVSLSSIGVGVLCWHFFALFGFLALFLKFWLPLWV